MGAASPTSVTSRVTFSSRSPPDQRSSEQTALCAALAAGRRLARRGEPDVLEPGSRRDATSRGARDQADLEQERLDDLLERAALLGQRGRDRLDPDGAAV